jgi:predicted Fe-Mo cluster-binding NifX family protein
MKIIIPLEDDNGMDSHVSSHFGQAPFWGIYDADAKQLVTKPNISQHGGGGCQAVAEIAGYGPDIVYTLGMGFNAIEKCKAQGIRVKSGTFTTVQEVIAHLNTLPDMEGGCAGSDGDCH